MSDAESDDGPKFFPKPSYVVVAIDTDESMFEIDAESNSPFKNTLSAIYRLCDGLLLNPGTRGWSPFSVVLYDNAEKAKINLVDFKDNMIDKTKLLRNLSTLETSELKEKYLRKDDGIDLGNFFQQCIQKFKSVKTEMYRRIIVFISNNPDPVNSDGNKRFTALNVAKNFPQNDVDFQLITTKDIFDFTIFYQELFSVAKLNPIHIICEDEEGLYQKISSIVWFRHHQRKVKFYPLKGDPTRYFTAQLKSYLRSVRLFNNNYVASDGTLLKKIKQKNNANTIPDSNKTFRLLNRKTRKTFENITFSYAEKLLASQSDYSLGYTLLYLCNRLTKPGEIIGKQKILDINTVENNLFSIDFWQHCVNENKVAVCMEYLSTRFKPKAVELIPKCYKGQKVFLVKKIPHGNEVYDIQTPQKRALETSNPHIETIIDQLIDKLTRDFSGKLLIDLKYQRKEAYLKSKLLDEPRKIQSERFPNLMEISDKLGGIENEFLLNTTEVPVKTKKQKR